MKASSLLFSLTIVPLIVSCLGSDQNAVTNGRCPETPCSEGAVCFEGECVPDLGGGSSDTGLEDASETGWDISLTDDQIDSSTADAPVCDNCIDDASDTQSNYDSRLIIEIAEEALHDTERYEVRVLGYGAFSLAEAQAGLRLNSGPTLITLYDLHHDEPSLYAPAWIAADTETVLLLDGLSTLTVLIFRIFPLFAWEPGAFEAIKEEIESFDEAHRVANRLQDIALNEGLAAALNDEEVSHELDEWISFWLGSSEKSESNCNENITAEGYLRHRWQVGVEVTAPECSTTRQIRFFNGYGRYMIAHFTNEQGQVLDVSSRNPWWCDPSWPTHHYCAGSVYIQPIVVAPTSAEDALQTTTRFLGAAWSSIWCGDSFLRQASSQVTSATINVGHDDTVTLTVQDDIRSILATAIFYGIRSIPSTFRLLDQDTIAAVTEIMITVSEVSEIIEQFAQNPSLSGFVDLINRVLPIASTIIIERLALDPDRIDAHVLGAWSQRVSPLLDSLQVIQSALAIWLEVSDAISLEDDIINVNVGLNESEACCGSVGQVCCEWWPSCEGNTECSGTTCGFPSETSGSELQVPSVPVLSTPNDGDVHYNGPITFSWLPAERAGVYQLLICPTEARNQGCLDPDGAAPGIFVVGTETTVSINSAREWYWSVAAANGAGFSAQSVVRNLTTVAPLLPPEAPELYLPHNGTETSMDVVTFEWFTSEQAVRYNLLICTDPGLQIGCVDPDGRLAGIELAPGEKKLDVELAPGHWYWAVRGIGSVESAGWGPFSPVWLVTVHGESAADETSPSLVIEEPTTGGVWSQASASLRVAGSVNDLGGLARLYWSNAQSGSSGNCFGSDAWFCTVSLIDGVQNITITAEDLVGNTSAARLTVNKATPTVSVSPSSGQQGTTFDELGSGFTPNSTASLYFRQPNGNVVPVIPQATDSQGIYSYPYESQSETALGVWQYWAIDNTTNRSSNVVNFTIISATVLPNPPNLISPPDGASFTSSDLITFSWGTADGATRYMLTICADPELTRECTVYEPEVGIHTQTVVALTLGTGTRHWAVRSIGPDESLGWGTNSPLRSFTITSDILTCPNDCFDHGVCNPNTGTCSCEDRYQGEDCGECARGFRDYPACVSCGEEDTPCCEEHPTCAPSFECVEEICRISTPGCVEMEAGPSEQPVDVRQCRIDNSRPSGFETAHAWFNAVHLGESSEISTVEISQLRLVGLIDGELIAFEPVGNRYHTIADVRAYDRASWFGTDESFAIEISEDPYLRFETSSYPDRVIHGWPKRTLIPEVDALWTEAMIRVEGSAAVQIGFDYWETMTSYFEPNTDVQPHAQGAFSSWFGQGCEGEWITIASGGHPNPGECRVHWVDESTVGCLCIDEDGDGYGVPTCPRMFCAGGNDCDDENRSINPGYRDVCDNNVDDDCDGLIDVNCGAPPVEVEFRITNANNLDGSLCLAILNDEIERLPMRLEGQDRVTALSIFPPNTLEFIVMMMSEEDCGGDWLGDLWPASAELRANGTLVQRCDERFEAPEQRSLHIRVETDGRVVDIGARNDCLLTNAPFGYGIVFSVEDYIPTPGNEVCLSIISPGRLLVEMEDLPGNRFETRLYIRNEIDLEFIVYEAQNGCSWQWDIGPASARIKVANTLIERCGQRSDGSGAQSMWAFISEGEAADRGDSQECPLAPAPENEGTRFYLSGFAPDLGNDVCLSVIQPGGLHQVMTEFASGEFNAFVHLRASVDGEFIIYESTNGCSGWLRDIYPNIPTGTEIFVESTPINLCGVRSLSPDAQSLYFTLNSSGQATDTGTQTCE